MPFVLANWKMIVAGIAASVMFFLGWNAHKMIIDAEKARSLESAIEDHIEDQKRSDEDAKDLAESEASYEEVIRDLNRELRRNRGDNSPVFNPDSVRRASSRIAAGEASRPSASD